MFFLSFSNNIIPEEFLISQINQMKHKQPTMFRIYNVSEWQKESSQHKRVIIGLLIDYNKIICMFNYNNKVLGGVLCITITRIYKHGTDNEPTQTQFCLFEWHLHTLFSSKIKMTYQWLTAYIVMLWHTFIFFYTFILFVEQR